ncbi:MAG: tRNA (N6-isopentenyl adenosine(37)-C2)-methylthiotransferase MiaB [Candidatus Cloacimonas sp. 4484_209]|nr:MAG: tRNA (N6-isopentenyl adenosine(37)-C2)-methylthiotransferase MiaB [Candidatus Cloacimonas sp. 4484_209]
MKKYYIITYGCQMNVYDSHLMEYLLEKDGFKKTDDIKKADAIIVNTCAVREHAVERAISRLKSLKYMKKEKPNLRIGLTGCIPQHKKEKLLEIIPFVDFIIGPDKYKNIVSTVSGTNGTFLGFNDTEIYSDLIPARGNFPEAFVSAMRGCNNFCSYCVVPYTRGKERSRNIADILTEIKKLADTGYKRVILLGQNVNNYNYNGNRLPHLLSKVAAIDGIQRIGFLTSHPAYFPIEVIDIMKEEKKIEKYLHLPVQSGSTRILKLMKRGYTKEEYLNLINSIRNKIPDIALSTDIIVGYPTEKERDFLETLELIKSVRFDFAYMFKYSVREMTLASIFPDDVTDEIKQKRLKKLIQIQNDITKQKSFATKNKIFDVLIVEKNKKNSLESDGITVYNKRVIVKGEFNKGELVPVKINDIQGWTPIGIPHYKYGISRT